MPEKNMPWPYYLLGVISACTVVAWVYTGGPGIEEISQEVEQQRLTQVAPQTAPPPPIFQDGVAQQLAQQAVLLERIATVLERWDAAAQAGTAAAEARRKRALEGWSDWTKDGGLKELPKTVK